MKKVLLTGATGFIGRYCLPLLVSGGFEVHAVTSRGPGKPVRQVFWHQVDLLVPGQASELVAQVTPDALLHLAWYAAPGKFWNSLENFRWVQASLELLTALAKQPGRRVVMAGTCAEYDWKNGECSENSTPLLPVTLYGTCKHSLQTMLDQWSKQTGSSSAWGRIFHLYGPGEHPSRLVASVVRALLRGELALCSDGCQVLDFLYVEDVASAFVALLESAVRGPVNIASGVPISVRTIIERIAEKIGRPDLIRLGSIASAKGPLRILASTQRLREEVGWRPQYDLDEGLDRTIDWWRNTGLRQCDVRREAHAL